MRHRRRLLSTAAAILAATVVAGCGGGHQSIATAAAPRTTTAPPSTVLGGTAGAPPRCVAAPASLNHAILAHVVLADARLLKMRAARATGTPGFYYVSGSISGSGTKHLLATWVTADLGGHKPIYSVDANAALISIFGASSGVSIDLSIDAPGAYRSRTCVAGSRATLGLPAPAGGHGAPAGQ
jgi:hypothetical protein